MGFNKETASKAGAKSSRKGSPNKVTGEIREAYQKLVEDNLDNVSNWLKEVADENPEKALNFIVKLSEYVVPKLNRTEIESGENLSELMSLTPEQRKIRLMELKNKSNNPEE